MRIPLIVIAVVVCAISNVVRLLPSSAAEKGRGATGRMMYDYSAYLQQLIDQEESLLEPLQAEDARTSTAAAPALAVPELQSTPQTAAQRAPRSERKERPSVEALDVSTQAPAFPNRGEGPRKNIPQQNPAAPRVALAPTYSNRHFAPQAPTPPASPAPLSRVESSAVGRGATSHSMEIKRGERSCCPSCSRCPNGSRQARGLLSGVAGASAIESISLGSLLGVKGSALNFAGWSEFGYHSNNLPRSQAYNDLRSFQDVPDHLHLNQQWIYLSKIADGSRGWDWGFRGDVVYGTDAQKTQAFGNPAGSFDEGWDRGEYGWALPQLYGEVAAGDASVKIGRFFSPLGFETVAAPGNFFYSRSYTMFNSEPLTHTGVLGAYDGIDSVTLYGGWTLGWNSGFDSVHQGNNWLGGLSYRWTDDVQITYLNTYGNFGAIDGVAGLNARDSYSHSIVMSVALTDALTYVCQSDYVRIDNPEAAVSPLASPNVSYQRDDVGLNQYLLYRLNSVASLGQRIEWWKQDGTSHYECTSGLNLRLLGNLVFRPEYRLDWSPGDDVDQRTFGMDMLLTY